MGAYEKINAMITERLVKRIEETGEIPWRKPWASVSLMPRNLVTGKNYRGVNVFLLHMLGFESPYFLSMKQINAMGGKVRKGERACPVVFWKIVEADDQDDPDAKTYAFLKYYRVFNVAQCEGLPEGKVPVIEVPKRKHDPIEVAERVVRDMQNPPRVRHGCRQASYSPAFDTVSMPNPEVFDSDAAYYAALNHELAHYADTGIMPN
ncbi:DNA primase TraC [Pontiella desulfatans]|uniref:DNA primase TraC n=1 Tax=Pontiella desulfatans TaxID=2750659 RepID=A0A6C2U2S3_PONDE|nr:ArdC-like ssDNA-binding domain-containing protein [Pontiella desulfatans]VGO14099.1 DNA primase TraC [Pontiella desulfatans]